MNTRTVDDIANDFVNAVTDEERAALRMEMDAMNEKIAEDHLREGNIAEYQHFIR